MAFFSVLLKKHPWTIILAALLGAVGGLINARLLSLVNENLDQWGEGFSVSGWYYLGLLAVAFTAGCIAEILLIMLSERVSANLRLNLSDKIINLPLRTSETLGKGLINATFTQDIPAITMALLRIPVLFVNGAITLGCLVYLGMLSPSLMGILMVFLIIALATFLIPERFAIRYLKAWRQAWDRLLHHFEALNEGAKELKLHAVRREAFFHQRLASSIREVRRRGYIYQLVYAILNQWNHVLFFLFLGVLIFVIPNFQTLDVRTITGFAITTLYLIGPIDHLINAVPRFRKASIAIEKAKRSGLNLQLEAQPITSNTPTTVIEPPERLTFHEVVHQYYREKEARHFALGPLSFSVRRGEILFIIGGNGSGKTTLAKLITGLYAPQTGAIHADGTAIDDQNREAYRQLFSAVFSDFYIFDEFLGLDTHQEEKITDYLRMLQLDHKVQVSDGKLSTTELSTGQRKRLALMTAYLENRPYYLFDEWAADQDPEFKEVFYRKLLPDLRQQGKTVFVISHDDRYFDCADRILKLADGQISGFDGPMETSAAFEKRNQER